MSPARAGLQEALQQYITDTFRDMKTLQSFMKESEACLNILQSTEEEMDLIRRGKKQSEEPHTSGTSGCCPRCVEQRERCAACLGLTEEVEKDMKKMTTKERTSGLEAAVESVQQQLENLQCPLQAMERLAMTSEQVFEQDLQEQMDLRGVDLRGVDLRGVDLRGVDLREVRRVLSVVKAVSPWVTVFKRSEIFKPTLEKTEKQNNPRVENKDQLNQDDILLRPSPADTAQDTIKPEILLETIEPLQLRLQAFISALKNICRPLQDSPLMELHLDQAEVCLSEELSEERAAEMLSLIQELQEIRKDKNSRLVFLLGDQAQMLTEQLGEREPQMNECVEDLKHCAKKLKHMNIGRLVSALVSSSMGAMGGVASLTGLGLMTITLKEASILLLTGLIVSALSGLTNLITLIADWLENRKRKIKANSVCEKLKGHMKVLQFCLNSATFSPTERIPEQDQITSGISIGSKFVSLVRLGDIISNVVLDVVSKEEADILQVVLQGPWSKSKFSRPFGLITNSVFLLMDLCIISYNIWVFCKKRHTPVGARWLTARAALWRADMKDWKKIRESLKKGQPRAERIKQLLNTALYWSKSDESEWV